MLLCVKQGFLEYQTLLISESQENNKYKIICSLSKCQFIVTKKIAAELRNIGGNFLPPRFIKIARTEFSIFAQVNITNPTS